MSADGIVNLPALLERMTFPPGWTVRYERDLTLAVEITTVDSNPPHEPRVITHRYPIPAPNHDIFQSERWVLGWIRELLVRVAIHELDEWVRLNGVVLNNPHA